MGRFLKVAATGAVMLGLMAGTAAYAQEAIVGLITKTEGNPFFVKMR